MKINHFTEGNGIFKEIESSASQDLPLFCTDYLCESSLQSSLPSCNFIVHGLSATLMSNSVRWEKEKYLHVWFRGDEIRPLIQQILGPLRSIHTSWHWREGPTGLGRFRGKQHEKRSISMKVHMADGGTKQGRNFPRLGRELAGSFILDSFAGSDWAVCQGSDLAPLVNHSKCTSRQLTLLLKYLSHAHVGRYMNLGSVRSRPYLDPRLLGLYSRLGSFNFSCSNYVHLVGENMY